MACSTLGSSAALRHIQGIHTIISILTRRVNRQPPHVVERRIERQTRTHPQVHVRPKVVTRRPEVIFIVA